MSKRKPCRTECWFDALLLESRKDLKFKGAFFERRAAPSALELPYHDRDCCT